MINMPNNSLDQWLVQNPMTKIEVDCATTVMLKIIDGKCKMPAQEKVVMAKLYDRVNSLPGLIFDDLEMHSFIKGMRGQLTEDDRLAVYEKRLLAETMLSRPIMKKFKARIRSCGLFDLAL